MLAPIAFLPACDRGPTRPDADPPLATVSFQASVAGTTIGTIVLEVSGPGIAPALLFNGEAVDGVVAITLTLPVGQDRTITARAFNAAGQETHQGSATVDIVEGTNPPLSIVLGALTGELPIDATVGTVVITVAPTSVALPVDSTRVLVATVTEAGEPVGASRVVWATSNPEVAAVDAGAVTGVSVGGATIMAVYGGVGATAAVTVSEAQTPLGDWAWDRPRTGADMSWKLTDSWAFGPGDVVVVGGDEAIYRWNGLEWVEHVPSATTYGAIYTSLWAASPDDIWIVGQWGVLVHWDGSAWNVHSASTFAGRDLLDVWGAAPNDIWAVGRQIQHYDGASWSTESLPSGASALRGVWGASGSDIWAVGDGGTIAHYDGSAWSSHAQSKTLTGATLYAAHGTGASDVYAVGDGGVVLHFDGSSWSTIPLGTSGRLMGVLALSPTDVWVTGDGGTAYHYDGAGWTGMTLPTARGPGGLSASSPTDVWGVGYNDRIYHYDGDRWDLLHTGDALMGAWGASDSDIWMVGHRGTMARYDGTGWRLTEPDTAAYWNGVWGSGESDVHLVGRDGRIAHWDGSALSPVTSPVSVDLLGVTGSGPGNVVAVGERGAILHHDGSGWGLMTSPTAQELRAVWAPAADQAYAVGAGGTILHNDGTGWAAQSSGTTTRLLAVHGFSDGVDGDGDGEVEADVVYAVGDGGLVLVSRPDDVAGPGSWTAVDVGVTQLLLAVHVFGSGDVLVAGGAGTLLAYDGTSWTLQETGVNANIHGIWAASNRDVWLAAHWGNVLHGSR